MLKRIVVVPGHEFWEDDAVPLDAATFASPAFVGHRQVTDAYLLALVQHRDGKLATLDSGVAELIAPKERERYVTIVIGPDA